MKSYLQKRSIANDQIKREQWNDGEIPEEFEARVDEEMNDLSRDKDTLYAENPEVKTKEEMDHEDYLKNRHKKLLHIWSREGEIE